MNKMRKIIIGKNSKLYKNYKNDFLEIFDLAISHKDISSFNFQPNDFILFLSYPRSLSALNKLTSLLTMIKKNKVVLLSTCSIVVNHLTNCYSYPKIKLLQEKYFSKTLHNLIIFRVGTIISKKDYVSYYGTCILSDKVFFKTISDFINNKLNDQLVTKFDVLDFKGSLFESFIYKSYCCLIRISIPFPCILRPLDFIVKLFGKPWYGYVALTKIISEEKK